MTVLNFGGGPGFFTVDIARMVGDAGSVIACDLQEGMLAIRGQKISNNPVDAEEQWSEFVSVSAPKALLSAARTMASRCFHPEIRRVSAAAVCEDRAETRPGFRNARAPGAVA